MGGGSRAAVPEVPLPAQFRQLFRDWAEGHAGFVAVAGA
jgi:hypothetical protein